MADQRHSGFDLEAPESIDVDLVNGANVVGVHNTYQPAIYVGAGADSFGAASTDPKVITAVPSFSLADLQPYESVVCEAYYQITGTNDKKYIWFQDGGASLLYSSAVATITDGTTTEFAATWQGIVRVKFTLQDQSPNNVFIWDCNIEDLSNNRYAVLATGTIAHDPRTDADPLWIGGKCDNIADGILTLHQEYYITKRAIV